MLKQRHGTFYIEPQPHHTKEVDWTEVEARARAGDKQAKAMLRTRRTVRLIKQSKRGS